MPNTDRKTKKEKQTDTARKLRRDLTAPEQKLWNVIRNRQLDGLKFRRQHPIDPYYADFCCEEIKLIIELDGMTHVRQADNDEHREAFLNKLGYHVMRSTNDDVLQNLDAVYEAIQNEVRIRGPRFAEAPSPGNV